MHVEPQSKQRRQFIEAVEKLWYDIYSIMIIKPAWQVLGANKHEHGLQFRLCSLHVSLLSFFFGDAMRFFALLMRDVMELPWCVPQSRLWEFAKSPPFSP